jgi:phosphohistidine phosphatase SixA
MILLVRHAHAGEKHRWDGPDSLRPLSATGQAEAAGLVVRLEDYPVGRVLSSPTVRCQETVRPLAGDRHLDVEPLPAVGVTADPSTWLLESGGGQFRFGRYLPPLPLADARAVARR